MRLASDAVELVGEQGKDGGARRDEVAAGQAGLAEDGVEGQAGEAGSEQEESAGGGAEGAGAEAGKTAVGERSAERAGGEDAAVAVDGGLGRGVGLASGNGRQEEVAVRAVAEVAAQVAEGLRGVAEQLSGLLEGEAVDGEGAESLALAVVGVARLEEEGGEVSHRKLRTYRRISATPRRWDRRKRGSSGAGAVTGEARREGNKYSDCNNLRETGVGR